jgi:hypothetical protein
MDGQSKNTRRFFLVLTGVSSALTLILLSKDPSTDCLPQQRLALWLTLALHLPPFCLLLLHFIYLGFLLSALARRSPLFLLVFTLSQVAAFIGLQLAFISRQPPLL